MIYVAGPMTGYIELNKPAFDAAKEQLTAEFFGMVQVVIPHDILPAKLCGFMPIEIYIRTDVEIVLNSSIVFMLNGWEDSKGANAEHAIAKWAGKQIRYQGEIAT